MISILMPLYNGEEFLNDSISSLFRQTFRDWELLIGINGRSDDGYGNFKDGYSEIVNKINEYSSDKIRYFIYATKGKVNTLNMLAKEAKHNIICLMDIDDYWFPEKLKKQLPFIGRYDVVGSDAAYFGKVIGTPGLFLGRLSKTMFTFQNPIINSAVMMKKELAQWDESWEGLDDYNLWLSLVYKDRSFYNVPEILVNHRIHDNSYFNNKNDEMYKKILETLAPLEQSEYDRLTDVLFNVRWEL